MATQQKLKTKAFDLKEAKAHPERVRYRNGNKPLLVIHDTKWKDRDYPILSIDSNGCSFTTKMNGNYLRIKGNSNDLVLLVVAEKLTKKDKKYIDNMKRTTKKISAGLKKVKLPPYDSVPEFKMLKRKCK